MTETEPLDTATASTATLLGELAAAVAGKDMAAVVAIAVELGRRVERGEISEVPAVPDGERRARRINRPTG
jgi:hypothetical protein